MKTFKDCKNGDTIYIYDFSNIERGLQEFKIIDIEYTPEKEDYCGCGPNIIPEHWDIHFESPYLDRHISIQNCIENNVIYSGSYAMNDNGKTVVKNIQLMLFADLDNAKQKIIDSYCNKIKYCEKNIETINKELDFLENKINQFSNEISLFKNDLNIFENIINKNI